MKNIFTIVILTSMFFFANCDEIFNKELELIQTLTKNIKEEPEVPKTRKMTINSDLQVTGSLTANTITCESSKITGNVEISKLLKANEIKSDKLTTNTLITERIVSPTGILTLVGDLVINNDVSADSIEMKGTSLIVDNVRQWGLTHHDDFETDESLDGWSDKRLSRCKEGGKAFLGGHCNLSYNEVNKTFKNLPEHSKLKINAAYHMLDSWEGETGYMKVDDEIVWSRKGESSEKGMNFCGGDYNDAAFNMYYFLI